MEDLDSNVYLGKCMRLHESCKLINFVNYKSYFLIETYYRQLCVAKNTRARHASHTGPAFHCLFDLITPA